MSFREHPTGPRTVVVVALAVLAAACADTTSPEVADDPDDPTTPTTHVAPPPDPGPCRPAPDPDEPPRLTGGGTTAAPTGDPEDAALWTEDIDAALEERFADRSAGAWLDPETLEVVVLLTAPDPDGDGVIAQDDDDIVAELSDLARDPDRVVCQRARATTAELDDLADMAFERLQPAAMMGGADPLTGVVRIDYEGDLEVALDRLGDLADHPALVIEVPDCAVWDPADAPEGALDLPGDGSLCGGMAAAFEGTLAGDADTGCLVLETDPAGGLEASEPPAILWPSGWTITADGTIHDQHGRPVVAIGERISAGGGMIGPTVVEPCGDDDVDAVLINGASRAD